MLWVLTHILAHIDPIALLLNFWALKLTLLEYFRALEIKTLLEHFSAIKPTQFDNYRALKPPLQEHFRALKSPPLKHFRALKRTLLEHFMVLKVKTVLEHFKKNNLNSLKCICGRLRALKCTKGQRDLHLLSFALARVHTSLMVGALSSYFNIKKHTFFHKMNLFLSLQRTAHFLIFMRSPCKSLNPM